MDQISRPVLIALIAVICFAAAWMTVLRPKAAESEGSDPPAATKPAAPQAPGVAGLTRAVGKAHGAVAASDAASAAAAKAAPDQTAAAAPAHPAPAVTKRAAARSAAKPAAAPAPAAPKPAAKPTVLLFAGAGADDAVARRVVRSVRRPGVRVIIAPLSRVGRYHDLLGKYTVTTAPTILVIGRDRQAHVIEGLPD